MRFPSSTGGYGKASNACAMVRAEARQIREDSCLLKGNTMLFAEASLQHSSDDSDNGDWSSAMLELDWDWPSHAQEVSHSARSSTKLMSKFVGACLRSQYGFVKTGKSEKALYLCSLIRALLKESAMTTFVKIWTHGDGLTC